MKSSGVAALLAVLVRAESLEVRAWGNSTSSSTVYTTCSDVPAGSADGYYMLRPPASDITVDTNEDFPVPAAGVSVYCRFEGGHAWALVATFADHYYPTYNAFNYNTGPQWGKAHTGIWNYDSSPAPDDTGDGTRYRFPLSFWNDLSQALPNGAMTYTSTSVPARTGGASDICPGFWKTSCTMYDAETANTPECAEPWLSYSGGTFTTQAYERTQGTGYTNTHGAIVGWFGLATQDQSVWTGRTLLTVFQHGWPAVSECVAGTHTYETYTHGKGFMFWIGGPQSGGGGAAGGASAVGDPHLQNVHGERFDLMKAGKHVLIHIPRGTTSEHALLRVQADVRQLGGNCADMYFQELNVTGSWAEAQKAGGYHYDVSQSEVEAPKWIVFGKVELKIARGRTDGGVSYFNVYVKHLGRTGFAVGGLLGEDDHEEAATAAPNCQKKVSLKAASHGKGGPRSEGSVAVASSA